jgi:hypothetical protein
MSPSALAETLYAPFEEAKPMTASSQGSLFRRTPHVHLTQFTSRSDTRRREARQIREEAAELAALRPHPDHISNGEEERYRRPDGKLSYIANYSKGLRHTSLGEVVPDAYRTLLRAIYSTDPLLFERTSMMGTLNGLNMGLQALLPENLR